ncbi:MAG: DUF1801 domain-containing protein [Terrimesophilobacter sp.]
MLASIRENPVEVVVTEKKPAAQSKSARKPEGFTAEEKAAMKARVAEMKSERSKADGLAEVLAKIAEMPAPDRELAQRVHEIIMAIAPELDVKTWYGMPAYAKDGKVICFFKPASKFKARYANFGFSDAAMLDDGSLWATEFALTALSPAVESRIRELVKRAVS